LWIADVLYGLCNIQEGKEPVEVTALHTEHVSGTGDVGRPPKVCSHFHRKKAPNHTGLQKPFFWAPLQNTPKPFNPVSQDPY
jgi:hypothetical protein